jgi:hypothetical protein
VSELDRARDSLELFAQLIGHPLTPVQSAALGVVVRLLVLIAPRQSGKTLALALFGLWNAFRRPGTRVLVVSAGEAAAERLLGMVRSIVTGTPLLAGSVVDESRSLVVLSNGSEIRSVPASERQIRGWSVDLLLIDEAAMVSDEIIYGASFPTVAARPDARIVLASTPWSTSGAFYEQAMAGEVGGEHVRTVRWSLDDAPWITPAAIDHARATLPELRFRAEYLAEFVGGADAYFNPTDLLAAVADYPQLQPADARGEAIVVGLDWGRAFDRHAIAAVGILEDYGANESPVLFVPFLETSQRSYGEQIEAIVGLGQSANGWQDVGPAILRRDPSDGVYVSPRRQALDHLAALEPSPGYRVVTMVTEQNGVGAMPSEQLVERMGGETQVVGVHSSARSQEDAFGRIRGLLSQRRLVLPDEPELLRQLRGLSYEPTAGGGLAINAANPAIHDDLADALSLAVSAVPPGLDPGHSTPAPPEMLWIATGAGVKVPTRPRPRHNALGVASRSLQSW